MDNSKREDIINACIKEFGEYGYKDANTNRIYREAGVSKGLIFHYFGSKENLFILAVEKCIDKVLEDFEQISIESLGFIDSLIAYQEAKSKFFVKNPSYYKILTQAFFYIPEELKNQLMQKYNKVQALSEKIFERLFDKVKLKDNVSKESAMQAVKSVTEYIQKKYTSIILKEKDYPQELARKINDELIEQINLVLYGISFKN